MPRGRAAAETSVPSHLKQGAQGTPAMQTCRRRLCVLLHVWGEGTWWSMRRGSTEKERCDFHCMLHMWPPCGVTTLRAPCRSRRKYTRVAASTSTPPHSCPWMTWHRSACSSTQATTACCARTGTSTLGATSMLFPVNCVVWQCEVSPQLRISLAQKQFWRPCTFESVEGPKGVALGVEHQPGKHVHGCYARGAMSYHRKGFVRVCFNHFWTLKMTLLQTVEVQAAGLVYLDGSMQHSMQCAVHCRRLCACLPTSTSMVRGLSSQQAGLYLLGLGACLCVFGGSKKSHS